MFVGQSVQHLLMFYEMYTDWNIERGETAVDDFTPHVVEKRYEWPSELSGT
jgi:hypothetical protein